MYLFIFLIVPFCCYSYYLTNVQKKYIKNILQNENKSNTEVLKVKKILISKYSWWAIGQGQLFKKKHNVKNNYVRNSEIIQSSLLGLTKSMKNYDGRVDVPYYSKYFIENELYKCLTRCQPFGRFTHYEMMKKKIKPMDYKRVEPIGSNRLYFEKTKCFYENDKLLSYDLLDDALSKLPPKDKQIFLLRYDRFTFKKRKNLLQIAKQMNYSIETIRQSLKKTKFLVLAELKNSTKYNLS